MDTQNKNRNVYRFQQIANRIESLISDGSILSGERLPAERKLASELRVSRSSVREALRILVQKDLIEISRGVKGGAFVKPPSFKQRSKVIEILLQFDRLSLDQIAEFRNQIESGVTGLAAARAKPDDLRLLNASLETVRSLLSEGSTGKFIEADQAVHLCVSNIAGNPLFTEAIKATFGIRRYFCRFHNLTPHLMEKNFQDLSAIVQAIENRRLKRAARIAREHVSRFNEITA